MPAQKGSLFVTTTANDKATVEPGAALVLAAIPEPGDYWITEDQVCDRIQTRANIGIQAEGGQFTAALRFGITKGSAGKLDKSITAEARIRF